MLIAGGGTGGHLYPALAIMEGLKQRKRKDINIGYIGTRRGLEADVISRYEWIEFFPIRSRGFARGLSSWCVRWNLTAAAELLVGLFQSLFIICRFKPHLIIGTGGHCSFSPLMWGVILGIPTMIHEANVTPGLANRLLAPWVDRVLLAHKETKRYLKCKVKVVGTPLRGEITKAIGAKREERDKFLSEIGLCPQKATVLVFGGSRGSEAITKGILDHKELLDGIQVLLIVGKGNSVNSGREGNIVIKNYLDHMGKALAACDIVVCRGGAVTLAEIAALGKPAIVIPWSGASGSHQEWNARLLERWGGCVMLPEEKLQGPLLAKLIVELLEGDYLQRMSKNSRNKGIRDGLDKTLREVELLIESLSSYRNRRRGNERFGKGALGRWL